MDFSNKFKDIMNENIMFENHYYHSYGKLNDFFYVGDTPRLYDKKCKVMCSHRKQFNGTDHAD